MHPRGYGSTQQEVATAATPSPKEADRCVHQVEPVAAAAPRSGYDGGIVVAPPSSSSTTSGAAATLLRRDRSYDGGRGAVAFLCRLTPWQMYETFYFPFVNSSFPTTLLSSALLLFRSKHILANYFLGAFLILLSPALVTHILPAAVLFAWLPANIVGGYLIAHVSVGPFVSTRFTDTKAVILFVILFGVFFGLSVAAAVLVQTPFN